MALRIWAVMAKELGTEEYILAERTENGEFRELVFAEGAYAQAVQAFDAMRDERLSFHKVTVVGTFGHDAHAHLVAHDGDDEVSLKPIVVIGG